MSRQTLRIAFVLPTFAFHIGQRVAEGIQQGFGNADLRLLSIVGGYLSPKGPRYLNTEYTWIYSEACARITSRAPALPRR